MTVKEYNRAVEEYSDGVYRFILKNLRDADRASDVVQDSFERLWRHVSEIEYGTARSWLFSTAYNVMIDILRKESKMVLTGEHDDRNLLFEGSCHDLAEILNLALERLPEQQRSVIMLRDYEGYSYREIAEITGLSEAMVKISIYRGRMELKRFIGSIEAVV
ncbi:MAG: RNA polymerase sigma factor [Bacteroidales bacterium]|jgi:RNA polymerase sigma-70 factor (ECF subfamily)|nr:RNA polymerase sigma factor [Bacteroidales bacterium]